MKAVKKPKKRPHPGVMLIAPKGAYVSWRCRYTDPDTGKTVWKKLDPSLTTAELRKDWAVDKAKELAQRRLALESGAVRATGLSLSDTIERYYEAHPHLAKRTLKDSRAVLARFQEWAQEVGVKQADDLNRARLTSFRAWYIKQPKRVAKKKAKRGARVATEELRTPRTINSDLTRIHVVLGYLRSAQLLPHLSGDDLRDALKHLRETYERKEYLRPREIHQLLKAAIEHDRETFTETRAEHAGKGRATIGTTPRYEPIAPFVLFMLLTGMRLHEAIAIQWSQVDLEARDHSGNPMGEIHLKGKQVRTRRARTVDLDVSPTLRDLLRAMDPKKSGSVMGLSQDLATSSMKRLRAEYGAPESFSFQALRRTCGTYLTCAPGLYGAASAFMSARRLGHSVMVAEKHYVGVIKGIPATAKTLEQAMGIEDLAVEIVSRITG